MQSGYVTLDGDEVRLTPLIDISSDKLKATGWIFSLSSTHQPPEWKVFESVAGQMGLGAPLRETAYVKAREAGLDNFVLAEGTAPRAGSRAVTELLDLAAAQDVIFGPHPMKITRVPSVLCAKRQTPLAKYTPPVKSLDGLDVFNNMIKAAEPPPTRELIPGQNTRFNQDTGFIEADIDGMILIVGNHITMSTEHVVNGDLDLGIGHLRLLGNLQVTGSILSGMYVEASGNVSVGVHIEDAQVKSGGSVTVGKGIFHTERGWVQAAQDITCAHAENARLQSGRDIIVKTEARYCRIDAQRTVDATAQQGVLLGGTISAGLSVLANVVGSQSCKPTEIFVGIQHTPLGKLIRQRNDCETWLGQIAVFTAEGPTPNPLRLTEEGRGLIKDLLLWRASLARELLRLQTDIEGRTSADNKGLLQLRINNEAFRRTQVTLDNEVLKLEANVGASQFVLDENTRLITRRNL